MTNLRRSKVYLEAQFEGITISNTEGFTKVMTGSTASSSSSPQNVAFVFENTNSTNEVSTAYCVSNLPGQNTKNTQTIIIHTSTNHLAALELDQRGLGTDMMEYDREEKDMKWASAIDLNENENVLQEDWHFAREVRIKGNQINKEEDAWNSGKQEGSSNWTEGGF
ncbi:hypothetical protein Tco_0697239 [Tanacetum coccineum]